MKTLTKLFFASILPVSACSLDRNYIPSSFLTGKERELPCGQIPREDGYTNPKQYSSNPVVSVGSRSHTYFNEEVAESRVYQTPKRELGSIIKASNLDIPAELTDKNTSLDVGLGRIAPSLEKDSILIKPLGSPAYEVNLHDLKMERARYVQPLLFTDSSVDSIYNSMQKTEEEVRYESGVAITGIAKLLWNWGALSNVREFAESVRETSNRNIKKVIGSQAELDYSGGRINLENKISFGSFNLDVDVWADPTNFRQQGVSIGGVIIIGQPQEIVKSPLRY